jgi:hypothetical protein
MWKVISEGSFKYLQITLNEYINLIVAWGVWNSFTIGYLVCKKTP